MTASDSRGSKSRRTKEPALRDAIGLRPVSSMSRTTVEALALSRPLVFAWFHFSTWRPKWAKR
jgi:hypothetical protein